MAELANLRKSTIPRLYTLGGWPQTWADLRVRLDALQWQESQQRQNGEASHHRWLSHKKRHKKRAA